MKKFVRKLIKSALNNAKNDGDLELSIMPEIVVEKPKEEKFGDFSTSLAMGLAKSERRKPYEIAEILSRHLQCNDDNIDSVTIAGPGFLNITMRRSFFFRAPIEGCRTTRSIRFFECWSGEKSSP